MLTIHLMSFVRVQFELANVAPEKQDSGDPDACVGETWQTQHLQSAVVRKKGQGDRFALER
jgi:hypothetical protein